MLYMGLKEKASVDYFPFSPPTEATEQKAH